jgi:hypothetical protein
MRLLHSVDFTEDQRFKASAFLADLHLHGHTSQVTIGMEPDPGNADAVTVDEAASYFPKTVADRLDRVLLRMNHYSKLPGDKITIDSGKTYPVWFCENDGVLRYTFEQLAKYQLPLQRTLRIHRG